MEMMTYALAFKPHISFIHRHRLMCDRYTDQLTMSDALAGSQRNEIIFLISMYVRKVHKVHIAAL